MKLLNDHGDLDNAIEAFVGVLIIVVIVIGLIIEVVLKYWNTLVFILEIGGLISGIGAILYIYIINRKPEYYYPELGSNTSKYPSNPDFASSFPRYNYSSSNDLDRYPLLYEDNLSTQKKFNHGDARYIPSAVRKEVMERDKGRCIICGSRIHLEYDHILPISKGGSNSANNIQILCQKCNRKKKDKIE